METKHHKINIPYCSHCGSTTNTLVKYNKKENYKQLYYCNVCNTERAKKYRKTESGILNSRKAVNKYELKHPERKSAWRKAQWKISKNKANKTPCVICGKLPTHKHHPNIDNPLKIIYVCPYHHKLLDKNLI